MNVCEKYYLLSLDVIDSLELLYSMHAPANKVFFNKLSRYILKVLFLHSKNTIFSQVVADYLQLLLETAAAGLRLHLPGHLMALFRQFEQHASALKAKHPEMKRSIKFDDSVQSLAMDVKLGVLSNWQRIAEHEMRQISRMRIEKNNVQALSLIHI